MSAELVRKVRYFAAQVESLRGYDDWHDLTNLFITRDAIEDELAAGAELDADLTPVLSRADEQLRRRRARLARDFPDAFALGKTVPGQYWWWHLDEDASVRRQAPRRTKTALGA